jgi:Ferritin-like domain
MPTTRRELLAAAGAATVTATVLAAPQAALAGGGAPAMEAIPVPERLQRLIGVELLLLFCYQHVLGSSILSPRARRTVTPFVGHEQAHIRALEAQLRAVGGTVPAAPPDIQTANRDLARRKIGGRLGQLKGDLDAVRLLLTTEQVTIGAYFVALTKLRDSELIQLACQIMANEAQHDAMIGLTLPKATPGSAVPYGLVQGLQ